MILPTRPRRCAGFSALILLATTLAAGTVLAQGTKPATPPHLPRADLPRSQGAVIMAVVNGSVITQGDIDNRRRLFALSTGMPMTPEVLDRLTAQVTRQLIDEKLRMQEILRRKIVVPDKDIAEAIGGVEQRNGVAPGALRKRLAADGVELTTLIDEIRTQIGWGQVLRQELGTQTNVSDADVKAEEDVLKAQTGRTEYLISEIFVPIDNPSQTEDAQRFAETIIQQLRAGAPFPVVAAQFSQSQTALQGGDLGWQQPNEIDPAVLRVLDEMPPGAISNPILVPGGISIATLRAKRQIGQDPGTVLNVRQIFYRFADRMEPNNPTQQQRAIIEKAHQLANRMKSCDDMDAAAKTEGDQKSADPGEIRLESVGVPALRQVMATLPLQKASAPLIAEDGVAVLMVCSRDQKNLGIPSRQELVNRILAERVELTSRRLMRDLQRRAMIDQRS